MVNAITLSASPLDAVAPQKTEARDPAKVLKAAQDFEALLMGQLLKNMRESGSGGWMGMDGEDQAGEQAIGVAEEFFARSLAASGGLGLAKAVAQGLSASASPAEPSK